MPSYYLGCMRQHVTLHQFEYPYHYLKVLDQEYWVIRIFESPREREYLETACQGGPISAFIQFKKYSTSKLAQPPGELFRFLTFHLYIY